MAKTENKTQPTEQDVASFLQQVEPAQKLEDCQQILNMMKKATGAEPKMWGGSIIGFGEYHYQYASGHEGDWFLTGFSPRKQNISVYIMAGFKRYEELMAQLGKYKTGKSCLYINKLEDVDKAVLEELIKLSARYVEENQSGC
ncbi:DUF1801 domain-containing protein [Kangiella koreensis]|uniref:YdhG-like domain-containing protein n=1 Tax=Kangiella koreensis (strain DSM 16069 / JCM 12317 / KCTC 12182 / SW-125) TaxID=523791 RepID=C7RB90_KANKD|nr:DUF1801 domain-containing protein [Kangiella koreensis]ACV26532.1 Domain of unknown function DUF1801 [Kangiella koreensis DSM 16069]